MKMKQHRHKTEGAGYIIIRQTGPQDWIFDFPRLTPEVQEEFHAAIDEMRDDPAYAKRVLRRLLRSYPEHIDACHHLALTWYWQGNSRKASEIWQQGSEFALKFFPPSFSMKRDRLAWGYIENRPFLRLYQGYGLSCLRLGKPLGALEVFENLLQMNSNDNQGNRGLAVECGFLLGNPEAVLRICDRYPDDAMEQLVYGRALALFLLKRFPEAQNALRNAVALFPLIAQELLKSRQQRPRDWDEQQITMGGKDQAYAYWQEHGKFWSGTSGALEWLREKSGFSSDKSAFPSNS